jgi:hypothetical protein
VTYDFDIISIFQKLFDWEIEAWKNILSWSGGLRFSLFTALSDGALKAHMYR